MPSSTTAISGLVRNSRSESGRPIWLLRFPLFLNTRYRDARNSAATSFVVVLPALPVMATTRVPDRCRTSRAISCSACSVSSTRITIADVSPRSGTSRSTTTAPAPRATTSATKSWPSNRSPRMATKHSPAAIVRESMPIRPMSARGLPRTTSPAVAAAMSAAVSDKGSTRYDTRDRARRRARALFATSTSSKGSTRPPIS